MRVFSANVTNGQVMADGGIVFDCPILGQGGDSTGVLVISENELAYIPNTTPDMAEEITIIKTVLGDIATTFNAISSGVLPSNAGGAITSGSFTSGISEGISKINSAIENLNKLQEVLK